MSWRHAALACGLVALLAGCTTPAPRPTVPPPPVPSAPEPAPSTHTPAPSVPEKAIKSVPVPDLWDRLRDSFAMHDCIAPAVSRAQRETRNQAGFEKHLQALLPTIDYVQRVAAQHHVAGEFVLLPWVESHFHETAPRRHRPAGMWQIMPITARALDLPTGRSYDGRLDKTASTPAVMALLAKYYDQWHDWRLAAMAYNTGEYRLRGILDDHGKPPASPVIPDLPVGATTRHHLKRLLAIACIISDPQRFDVTLPTLDPVDRLDVVTLPTPARLRQVAQLTGMSVRKLRKLNAGYRRSAITTNTPMHVLLPVTAAQSLREAIAAGLLHSADGLAGTGASGAYTVVSGDSLWGIAQHFGLSVKQLRRWNDLDSTVLQPGQVLELEPPPQG